MGDFSGLPWTRRCWPVPTSEGPGHFSGRSPKEKLPNQQRGVLGNRDGPEALPSLTEQPASLKLARNQPPVATSKVIQWLLPNSKYIMLYFFNFHTIYRQADYEEPSQGYTKSKLCHIS